MLPEPSALIVEDDSSHFMKSEEFGVTASAADSPIRNHHTFASSMQDSRLDQSKIDWSLGTGEIPVPVQAEQVKSCCANKSRNTSQPSLVENGPSMKRPQSFDGNALMEPFLIDDYDFPNLPLQHPIDSRQQQTSQDWLLQSQQITMYKPPAGYATAEEPLRPSQLGLPQYDLNSFSTHLPMNPQYGLVESLLPSAEPTTSFNPAHFCSCGDSCSCLACPVHPYNITTRNHVQDLGQIIVDDYNRFSVQRQLQNSIQQHSRTTSTSNNVSDPVFSVGGNLPSPETQEFYDSLSPTTQHFDHTQVCDGHIPNVVPHPFESTDYYTMEFPLPEDGIQGGCTEFSGACHCLPNECTCVGCLTHHPSEDVIVEGPKSMLIHQDWNNGNAQYQSTHPIPDLPATGHLHTSCCEKALL